MGQHEGERLGVARHDQRQEHAEPAQQRAGIGLVYLNDIDEAIKDIEWIAEADLAIWADWAPHALLLCLAAMLGAEEYGVGTAALVALGDNDPRWEDEYRKLGTTAGAYDDWHEGNDRAPEIQDPGHPAGAVAARPSVRRS